MKYHGYASSIAKFLSTVTAAPDNPVGEPPIGQLLANMLTATGPDHSLNTPEDEVLGIKWSMHLDKKLPVLEMSYPGAR
jgi:hypothetical protein